MAGKNYQEIRDNKLENSCQQQSYGDCFNLSECGDTKFNDLPNEHRYLSNGPNANMPQIAEDSLACKNEHCDTWDSTPLQVPLISPLFNSEPNLKNKIGEL